MRALFAVLLCSAALPAYSAVLPVQRLARVEMQAVDVAAALRADAVKPGTQPFRFAVPIQAAMTPTSHGQWETLPDGRLLWRLKVRSPGADSLNFGFSKFFMPAGGALRIYAADGSQVRGPYTSAHNNAARQLWTPIVKSEEVVIEAIVPAAARSQLELKLASVNHGFRGFGAGDTLAKSGSCNIDVACSDAAGWGNEIRSVARYTVGGALLCTGQLLNNTAQDFTPYFLSASHCMPTAAVAPTTVYYWNYQTSSCGGEPDGNLDQSQVGAVMLATSGAATGAGSDFALVRLLQAPDAAYNVHYSGWDRRDLAPNGVTGIHHPNGDEKRISHDFDPLEIAAYLEPGGSGATHLRVVRWDRGVTEGGSSGSGIWNNQHRLVGTLSGGYSSCDAPAESDWYGRFQQHWSALPTPLTSVASWLDPGGTGAEVLDGANPGSGTSPSPPGPSNGNPAAASGGGSGGALPAGLLLICSLAWALRRNKPA